MTCSIAGCLGPVKALGWCSAHYQRYYKYGDPLAVRVRIRVRRCSVDGCSGLRTRHGLCDMHARRLAKYGDPLHPAPPHRELRGTPEERLLSNYEPDPESGCWRWQGTCGENGYGQIQVLGKRYLVHRLAHELWIGPIPDGYEVDHVRARGCVHRDCFNPTHLEAVTPLENMRRAHLRTHCRRGHELTPETTYTDKRGKRACKACQRITGRALRARRRAERLAQLDIEQEEAG